MHSFKTEAIIIKRKNIGEADRVLTLFTKQRGKIQVLAKGVRKITSKRSSHIELMNHSVVGIYESKMLILTEAECINHYSDLKNDFKKAAYAFYICELVDGLLADNQDNREIFNLLNATLMELEKADNPKGVIKYFEKEILTLLGFWSKEHLHLSSSVSYIESIMEKKIKTKRILPEIS